MLLSNRDLGFVKGQASLRGQLRGLLAVVFTKHAAGTPCLAATSQAQWRAVQGLPRTLWLVGVQHGSMNAN